MNVLSASLSWSSYSVYSARASANGSGVARAMQNASNAAMAMEEGDDEIELDSEIEASEGVSIEEQDEADKEMMVAIDDDELERREKQNSRRERRHQHLTAQLVDVLV